MEGLTIAQEINVLMNKINNKFKCFTDLYLEWRANKITEKDLKSKIHNILITFNNEELIEYNDMCKMFSETNCWYVNYEVGKLVHYEIIKILCPDDEDIGDNN